MAIIRIGVDLAKNVFAVHGVNEAVRVQLTRTVRREQLLEVLAAVPPCLVAMEVCSGAHHWARQLVALGHTRRIAPCSPYTACSLKRWLGLRGAGHRAVLA